MDQAVEHEARSLAKKDIGGQHQRLNSVTVEYDSLGLAYILAPVWTSTFYDRAKSYGFWVNGRTGKTRGQFPKSKPRVVAAIAAFPAVVALVVVGVANLPTEPSTSAHIRIPSYAPLGSPQQMTPLAGSVPWTVSIVRVVMNAPVPRGQQGAQLGPGPWVAVEISLKPRSGYSDSSQDILVCPLTILIIQEGADQGDHDCEDDYNDGQDHTLLGPALRGGGGMGFPIRDDGWVAVQIPSNTKVFGVQIQWGVAQATWSIKA